MCTGVGISLEPKVSFEVASRMLVTISRVTAAVALERPAFERQACVQPAASHAQLARRKPAISYHDLRERQLSLVINLSPERPETHVADRADKALEISSQRLRTFYEAAVAERCQSLDAEVDVHGPCLVFAKNDRHIDFDVYGDEPAVGGPADGGARDLALEAQGFSHLHLANAR